jgi:hypothetical protein
VVEGVEAGMMKVRDDERVEGARALDVCDDGTRLYRMLNVSHHHHSPLSCFWLVNAEMLKTRQGRGETIELNICEKHAVKNPIQLSIL